MIKISDISKCCGCQACVASCEKTAISMIEDDFGNTYPIVDETKCIHCDACDRVCPLINVNENDFKSVINSYAVSLKNKNQLRSSASGGAFFGIASLFIERIGGIVYGCAYDENMVPMITSASSIDELNKFQGSKYVMSTISNIVFKEIRENLKKGLNVLFSGVPCQCSAIRMFCRGFEKNLYTLELICHGFTSQHYFLDYIDLLEKEKRTKIVDFRFRSKDKSYFVARYVGRYIAGNGIVKYRNYHTNPATSYYYNNFLSGRIYRENCYVCKFARIERCSDITIGDFWGYQGRLSDCRGVSALLCNSEKGHQLIQFAHKYFEIETAALLKISDNNEQLKSPVPLRNKDYSVLIEWQKYGADYQNKMHRKKHIIAYICSKIGVFR